MSLQQLRKERGADIASVVELIVYCNLGVQRVQRFLQNGSVNSPQEYVTRVADHYQYWNEYIRQVQILKSTDVWEILFEKLQNHAYFLLCRKGFPTYGSRLQIAIDSATDASAAIIESRFPYDVHFERWAYRIVEIMCLRQMRRAHQSINLLVEPLRDREEYGRQLPQLSVNDSRRQTELRLDLYIMDPKK